METSESSSKSSLQLLMKKGRRQKAKQEEEMQYKLEEFLKNNRRNYNNDTNLPQIDDFVLFVSSLRSDQNEKAVETENVGLVFDKIMLKHENQCSHPERPGRISKPLEMLLEKGILSKIKPLNGRQAEKRELLLVHDEEYLEDIASVPFMTNDERSSKESSYNSIYMCEDTYECALVSCGSTLVLIENILNGNVKSGIALVRPPGHHAESHSACGFCFYNNVAVAARRAQSIKKGCKVLIFDWDIHHGNGTQHMFYDDSSVLYISLHRFDEAKFFPSSAEANYVFSGIDDGAGHNVNVAWNGGQMGDSEYMLAFETIVLPIANDFKPDLVIVSAGFDAAKGDPLGGYKVTPSAYGYMTHKLHTIADGNVAIILEGGYNLNSVSKSILCCTEALLELRDQNTKLEETKYSVKPKTKLPKETAVESILNTIQSHASYWDCLSESLNIVNKVKQEVEMEALQREMEMNLLLSDPNKGTTTRSQARLSGNVDQPSNENLRSKSLSDDSIALTLTHEPVSKNGPQTPTPESNTLSLIDFLDKEVEQKSKPVLVEKYLTDDSFQVVVSNHDQPNEAILVQDFELGIAANEEVASLSFIQQLHLAGDECGYVTPLNYCPHLVNVINPENIEIDITEPCIDCGNVNENWICLTCSKVFCGRYVNAHMVIHYKQADHSIAMSFSDLSFWCYKCDAYLNNYKIERLKKIYDKAHVVKHQCKPQELY